MDKIFFEDLDLPKPTHHFVRPADAAGSQSAETARILEAVEPVLIREKPDVVLVQGDTNSVLAGVLAAAKIPGIRIGHVEAGLRSFDRAMPEEINRIVADHASHYLFAPTQPAKRLLLKEGISPGKIFVTGNTIVDAVKENRRIAQKKIDLVRLTGGEKRYILVTMHRQENVDRRDRLAALLKGIELSSQALDAPVIFPVHPRTLGRLKAFGLKVPPCVRMIEPVGFLEFLRLEEGAFLLMSDSGGVQEEGCILGVPCVTLRDSTERPETVTVGANRIAGHDPQAILKHARAMVSRRRDWKNPFGDGRTGERILDILRKDLR
jgi:UDP-N-acetylglucosamine 2-epimerase (non-hydrolysing)